MAKGKIGVHTENIFPIIKQWLYSDKDIFVRELVSNGCDAVAKLKKLISAGEADAVEDEFQVNVIVNKEKGKLVFSDNGIGMTAEEVEKYITQVAFSGAEEFLAKYKDADKEGNTIIGHFGLGFYSAFMVADTVEIETLSYQKGAAPVHWECDGGIEYDIKEGMRNDRGTTITLHVSEENKQFLDVFKIREILNKYCSFLPVKVFLTDSEHPDEKREPINDTHPLWLKTPSECTDEEYKEFYSKVFMDFEPPLFWIHLNVDYPFHLKGILYFPKLRHEASSSEGQIKLYNNQVFVADNIKEVIPEYLMLLKGCIDCPDIPLNVSRSFLQNDGFVHKVSAHITKKVADKLTGMFRTERETYEKYWEDINPFIKFGCLKDDSFYEKMKDAIIFKTINGKYVTLADYLEEAKETHENKVYYVSNPQTQAQYISMFQDAGIDAIEMPYALDTHFISFLEYKNNEVKFERIDANVADSLKADTSQSDEDLIKLFQSVLEGESLEFETAALKNDAVPAIITVDEQARRMQEMSAMFMGAGMDTPQKRKLIINTANPVVRSLQDTTDEDTKKLVCNYIYDLAKLANHPLDSEGMSAFLARSNEILKKIHL